MRRSIAIAGALALGVVTLTPGIAPAAPTGADPGLSPGAVAALSAGLPAGGKAAAGAKPTGPNPYLALLPDPSKADYSGWSKLLVKQAPAAAAKRLRLQSVTTSPLLADEDEPAGTRGANDSPDAAQLVRGFGTAAGQNPKLRVLGALNPDVIARTAAAANTEDDGAIPLAGDPGVGGRTNGVVVSGAQIGDGPHGSAGDATGDLDFYQVHAKAGQLVTVDTDTPTGALDTIAVLYNAAGDVLAANDDDGASLDSKIAFTAAADATYYVLITGFNVLPADPNDSGSGTGAESEGPYSVAISATDDDVDFYAVNLRKGDVLGASVKGAAARLAIYDTVPREVHGSAQDFSFIYPATSPLPGGGNAVTEYVSTKAGWHFVGVSRGAGGYDVTVEAFRPPLEASKGTQTLFLDFDGARMNMNIFDPTIGVRQLSPLAAFLAKWGIPRVQEDALIDAIVARVTENVKQDLIASGLNSRFKLKILNSRDNADPFGQPNVSRIVVGGTIDESGVETIGISQSIDPGNFATAESAMVLLDVLSGPSSDDASLNAYLTPASNRIGFVGSAIGNVVSHEAGHFFGNWHVDQFDDRPNLMDQGGNFPPLFGVGPDGVGGTADDPDVDFGDDTFNPAERFTGTEDTLGRPLFGITS